MLLNYKNRHEFGLSMGLMVGSLIIILVLGLLNFSFLQDKQLTYSNEDAVVFINGYGYFGSGVCVDPDGIIVTAAHMIKGPNMEIRFPNGESYFSQEIYIDSHRDIAIFRIYADKPLPYIELGNSSELMPGDEIEIIGAPLGLKWWHSYGYVSRIPYNGDIYMDITGSFGSSGCPIIHNNKMVGILTCKMIETDGLMLGIESDYVNLLLDIYEFFDSVDAKSPFLDFVKQTQHWLMESNKVLITK